MYLFRSLMPFCALSACLATATAADWPQWHGPQRTGVATSPMGVPADASPEPVWQIAYPKGADQASGCPVVVDGLLYDLRLGTTQVEDERVFLKVSRKWLRTQQKKLGKRNKAKHRELGQAIDRGRSGWASRQAFDDWLAEAGFAADVVAVIASAVKPLSKRSENTLTAYDLHSGEKQWETTWVSDPPADGGMHATMACVDEVLYLVDGGGRIRARSAQDGSERWTSDEVVWGRYAGANASPVVDDGRVYLARQNGVFALSASDGSLLWATEPAAKNGVPHTEDNTVGLFKDGAVSLVIAPASAATLGPLVGLDAATGEPQWSLGGAATRYITPVIVGKRMVVQLTDTSKEMGTHIYDLTQMPPTRVAMTPPPKPKAKQTCSTPVVNDEWIWWGNRDGLHCLSLADGSKRWESQLSCGDYASPTLAGDKLVVMATDKGFSGWALVDAANGQTLTTVDLPRAVHNSNHYTSPVVADGHVVIKVGKGLLVYDLQGD